MYTAIAGSLLGSILTVSTINISKFVVKKAKKKLRKYAAKLLAADDNSGLDSGLECDLNKTCMIDNDDDIDDEDAGDDFDDEDDFEGIEFESLE